MMRTKSKAHPHLTTTDVFTCVQLGYRESEKFIGIVYWTQHLNFLDIAYKLYCQLLKKCDNYGFFLFFLKRAYAINRF